MLNSGFGEVVGQELVAGKGITKTTDMSPLSCSNYVNNFKKNAEPVLFRDKDA